MKTEKIIQKIREVANWLGNATMLGDIAKAEDEKRFMSDAAYASRRIAELIDEYWQAKNKETVGDVVYIGEFEDDYGPDDIGLVPPGIGISVAIEKPKKRKLYEVWKEEFFWKVQFPKGILTFQRKKDALMFAEDGQKTAELLKGGKS